MNKNSRRKKGTRIAVVFLTVLLTGMVSGCGNDSGGQEEAIEGQNTQLYAEGTPMGRYVEEQVALEGEARVSGNGNCLYRLDNGKLFITDSQYPFVVSKDNGKKWYMDKRSWNLKMVEEGAYIMSAAIGGDDTVAVIYQEALDGDSQSAADGDGSIDLNPKLLLILPDKTEIPVSIELTEEEGRLKAAYLSDGGRIFVTTQSAHIYEVTKDGGSRLFLNAEDGSPDLIQFQDDLMFLDGWDYEVPRIYDMEQESYIEDEVLEEFVRENYADRSCFGGNWYDMFFFSGKDGALYIAGSKGVYRHVLGGSAMEQIIDGSLSAFGNPSNQIAGMVALEDNEFLVLFSGGKLVRFTYRADIPTVPAGQLKVYSLEDNASIRQAINLYQTENPEMYVEYEVGMDGDNSITREDALKSLNTRILAGEGPDIFILDDMPVDSYIEKGMLRDLSPIFSNRSGEDELFGNIVDAFRTNEGIYMMPCEIRLPMIVGRKSEITGIEDLSDIADAAEKLRRNHPQGDLFRLYTEKGIMRMFSPVCEPVWMTEDGAVDREMISEFLEQTKRIYDAQMDGIADHVLEYYDDEWNAFSEEEHGAPWDETDTMRISMDCLRFAGGMSEAVWGYSDSFWHCAETVSVSRVQGYEDCGWVSMNGQCKDVFYAMTLLGISAASEQAGTAEDFVKALFGKENQGNLYEGLPVNKAAFLAGFASESGDADERWGGLATDNYEGKMISLSIYCPNQSQVADLQAYMESVKTPYMENTVLEDAVYEEGIAYMQGRKSLSEALDSIEKKMDIYLAE